MRMIDWEARSYQISSGRLAQIAFQDVRDALDVRNNTSLSPGGVYVRESFDRLFHHMGKIKRALKLESHQVR
jgi:hypothetical protein